MKWKTIPGWIDYEVSDLGKVRKKKTCELIQPGTSHGRNAVALRIGTRKRQVYVAHLVLESFVGVRPKRHLALHYDDVCTNDALSNLAWGTYKQNSEDSLRNGRHVVGERHVHAKLTEKKVRQFLREHSSKKSTYYFAAKFGCSRQALSNILEGRSWRHVTGL